MAMDELPRLVTEAHWNHELLQPRVAPGSVEEERALAELDVQRALEERELADTPAARRRRLERHWSRHG